MKRFLSFLKEAFSRKNDVSGDPVSEFFRHASIEEKERILRETAKRSSNDQRKLLEKYDNGARFIGA